jgi:hypothetical protein
MISMILLDKLLFNLEHFLKVIWLSMVNKNRFEEISMDYTYFQL